MSYNDLPSRVIPGGAHTYSKGDDQFPAIAPVFWSGGKEYGYGMIETLNTWIG